MLNFETATGPDSILDATNIGSLVPASVAGTRVFNFDPTVMRCASLLAAGCADVGTDYTHLLYGLHKLSLISDA
jgi:hypothetical protein